MTAVNSAGRGAEVGIDVPARTASGHSGTLGDAARRASPRSPRPSSEGTADGHATDGAGHNEPVVSVGSLHELDAVLAPTGPHRVYDQPPARRR